MRRFGDATHTLAKLEVSQTTYDEIAALFKEAGYTHVFAKEGEDGEVMDMTGIALTAKKPEEPKAAG